MTTARAVTVPRHTDDHWPTDCAEAHTVIFRLRRSGLPLLPGISYDDWASSILSWSTGEPVRCDGLGTAA